MVPVDVDNKWPLVRIVVSCMDDRDSIKPNTSNRTDNSMSLALAQVAPVFSLHSS